MEDTNPKRSKSTHPQTQITTTPTQSSLPNPRSLVNHPDIIPQILLKLSAKPLSRFKIVSKEWCNIISSPKFSKEYLKLSLSAEDYARYNILGTFPDRSSTFRRCSLRSVISETQTESFDFPDYPLKHAKPDDKEIKIRGSCNGLVLLLLLHWPVSPVAIWNPTTGESITVPYYYDTHVCPGSYMYKFGFGYDEVHDDYKVIELFRDTKIWAKMFSLRTGSWRVLEGGFKINNGQFMYCSPDSIHVDGNIHWSITILKGYVMDYEIMVLNLAREQFGKVELPDHAQVDLGITLGVASGCLCVLNFNDLWVMKKYGDSDSWTRMFTFPDLTHRSLSPLCIVSGGIIVSLGAIETSSEGSTSSTSSEGSTQVAKYEPTGEFVPLPISNFEDLIDAHLYLESMVSPSAYSKAEGGQGGPE